MSKHGEYKRNQRDKKRSEGYVLKQIWVKPASWPELKKIIASYE